MIPQVGLLFILIFTFNLFFFTDKVIAQPLSLPDSSDLIPSDSGKSPAKPTLSENENPPSQEDEKSIDDPDKPDIICEDDEEQVCVSETKMSQVMGMGLICKCEKKDPPECEFVALSLKLEQDRSKDGESMLSSTSDEAIDKVKSCLEDSAITCKNPEFLLDAGFENSGGQVSNDFFDHPDDCVYISAYLELTDDQGILDSDCNPLEIGSIADDQICGDVTMSYIYSPISLLWTEDANVDHAVSVTSFPLDPSSGSRWFTWKASSLTPLLVYDPNYTGFVNDPTQLFGNWTFGGRQLAALSNSSLRQGASIKPLWDHGYEPLAVLDRNKDGKLSGPELSPLALWFDNNQDGISQPGEVKRLNEVDVVKLYVTPDGADPETLDIYASRGYERIINGKKIIGKTVDWFAEGASSKMELLARLQKKSFFNQRSYKDHQDTTLSSATDRLNTNPESDTQDEYGKSSPIVPRNISGSWQWNIQESGGLDLTQDTFGLLVLQQNGTQVSGYSLIESPIKSKTREVRALLTKAAISGKQALDTSGKIVISFQIANAHSLTKSEAFLSRDGKTLFGRSTTKLYNTGGKSAVTSVNYTWIAHRM